MTKRNNPLFVENLFRPVFEVNAGHMLGLLSVGNVIGASSMGTVSMASLAVTSILATMSLSNYIKAKPRVQLHAKIKYNDFLFVELDELLLEQEKDEGKFNVGLGFEWGPEHANRVRALMSLSSDLNEIKLPFLYQLLLKDKQKVTKDLGGYPFIHAVGGEKTHQKVLKNVQNLKGHTMIYGLVGTGKTTMLTLLSTMALCRGNTVFVIDPKNDKQWKNALKYTAKIKNVPFYEFHPGKPSSDIVRIDAIGTYQKASEIASRLKSILPSGGDSEAFAGYAWDQFNTVAEGLLFVGIRPNLLSMHSYLFNDRQILVEKGIDKYIEITYNSDKSQIIQSQSGSTELEKKIVFFRNVVCKTDVKNDIDARNRRIVTNLINYITTEDPSRYATMMSTTKPLIKQLVSPPLDELLSPVFEPGSRDRRPIVTSKGVMDTGGVFYISLDGLTDSTIAAVTAKMLLADVCASAGERYNSEEKNPLRLSLFVDEAHSALNDPLVDLMAMGRAAEVEVYLSSQTQPDYEDKAGPAIAKRLTGLCGNVISMRVSDKDTQEFITSRLGETRVRDVEIKVGSNKDTDKSIKSHGASFSQGLKDVDSDMFPKTLLSDLPILQYVGHFSDGSKVKGLVPILQYDESKSKLFKERAQNV